MSLESVFKLSLIMNMIDNLSGPMAGVASKVGANVSKLDAASQTFGSMAKALGMDDIDWESIIAETVPEKFRELNLRAFRAGHEAAGK